MTNAELAKLLRNVAASYSITNEKEFRFQILAYQRAADAIESSTSEVQDLFKEKRLSEIPGIGTTLKSRLEELFTTGKVKHFEDVMAPIPDSVFVLMEIPSFGPKKAFKLVKEFGLTNPETVTQELVQIAEAGKIATLDGFGEKSQADILRAIAEYKQGFGKTKRMILPFALELSEGILKYLLKSKYIKRAEALGSLRRRAATVGDIDIAVATEDPKAAIDYFVEYPYKERVIEKGDVTSSFLTSGGKQVDLMTVPPDRFGSLIQHFSGSKNHNVHLRELALKKGMSLSERGIKHLKNSDGEIEKFATEESFYKALGMDWVPPEMREDVGEIELAIARKLPHLVELTDIKGDFHIHSNYPIEPSHDLGLHSMEDMLKKAIALGYAYFGFSEHNPSVSKHTSQQIYDILAKRKEHIEKLQEKYKQIKIFSLMETDILANGKLALDDKALELLDATLVSIHSSFATERNAMTKRVLKGLSHPKAKILSHPTGRLLNERQGYELDWDEIFTFCDEQNKALEINAWPTRLDLPDNLVREAMKRNLKFTIDTDSHALDHMDNMRYGISVARRGWATKDAIINCWPVEKVSRWLLS